MAKDEIKKYLQEIGSKGGKATAKKMTSEQRKQRAKKAAKASVAARRRDAVQKRK